VRYYVGGSIASSIFGMPRTTMDVDLVADLRLEHVASLVDSLKGEYYASDSMIRDAIARRSCFNVIHMPTMYKVDIFVLKNRPYDHTAIERASPRPLDLDAPRELFQVAAAEDTVLAKLEWYRLGDEVSERQWKDVLEVLRVQRTILDCDYMAQWAAELGVADLLQRAWQEAEE
jgi:hypothetical protein